MSPINLSEFREELENDDNIKNAFQLAEDVLKLKEGNVKTDAEIFFCSAIFALVFHLLFLQMESRAMSGLSHSSLAFSSRSKNSSMVGLSIHENAVSNTAMSGL